jgi:hypothetical protein
LRKVGGFVVFALSKSEVSVEDVLFAGGPVKSAGVSELVAVVRVKLPTKPELPVGVMFWAGLPINWLGLKPVLLVLAWSPVPWLPTPVPIPKFPGLLGVVAAGTFPVAPARGAARPKFGVVLTNKLPDWPGTGPRPFATREKPANPTGLAVVLDAAGVEARVVGDGARTLAAGAGGGSAAGMILVGPDIPALGTVRSSRASSWRRVVRVGRRVRGDAKRYCQNMILS